eukprot:CAMPEP_0202979526 /NCGR_PEP_ID=MMETSP1396-20130829/85649_1 /ASSEMBLY_ACC=CAM_ASM_000872 /TAXON_ID= /ORGANISM="Pseudokeronopsis sp., Strain Brazil" /LENGTH=46 /DNA_ID= /DNA_START= /DNA_END= /DNA_ORIENTATION=
MDRKNPADESFKNLCDLQTITNNNEEEEEVKELKSDDSSDTDVDDL